MLFIELVPRDLSTLCEDASWILSEYPEVKGINIPDVLRLSNRSHDAVASLLKQGIPALPHIRAIDRPIEETLALIDPLIDLGLDSVLLISGDPLVMKTPSFMMCLF